MNEKQKKIRHIIIGVISAVIVSGFVFTSDYLLRKNESVQVTAPVVSVTETPAPTNTPTPTPTNTPTPTPTNTPTPTPTNTPTPTPTPTEEEII